MKTLNTTVRYEPESRCFVTRLTANKRLLAAHGETWGQSIMNFAELVRSLEKEGALEAYLEEDNKNVSG